jgi:GntR family transcriptional regulator/MocR family aminotransferase
VRAAEGFVVGRVGAGTVVVGGSAGGPGVPATVGVRPRAAWSDRGRHPAPAPVGDGRSEPAAALRFDLSVGTPDPALFPLTAWRREVVRALDLAAAGGGGYGDPAGHPALREAVARQIAVSRGVRATAETVVITSGAQQALALLAEVLLDPGEVVAVEEPGYPPARSAFVAAGADVLGVPVDAAGVRVEAMPPAARLAYVTPSHQFPTGATLALPRRTALLAWAADRDAVIVEDDYDSEFRFGPRPLEPLQALDGGGRVVYVGSFSKTMAPWLRLGYVVAPPSLAPALRVARRLADWHGELTTQLAMAGFIASGRLAWHLRRSRKVYAERHARLVAAVAQELGAWVELVPSSAGLHVCALFREGVGLDPGVVSARAAEAGVRAETVARYRVAPGRDGLVLGFGRLPVERIEPAIRALAGAFRG